MPQDGPDAREKARDPVLGLLTHLGLEPGVIPESEAAFARELRRRHEAAGRSATDGEAFDARMATVYAILAAIRHEPTPESITLDAVDHALDVRSLRILTDEEPDSLHGFVFENLLVMLTGPDGIDRLALGRTDPESLDALVRTTSSFAMLRIATDPDVVGSEISHGDLLRAIRDVVPLAHAELDGTYEERIVEISIGVLIPEIDTDDPDHAIDALARYVRDRAEAVGLDGEATAEVFLDCVRQCRMGVHMGSTAFTRLPVVAALLEQPDNDELMLEAAIIAVTCYHLSFLPDHDLYMPEVLDDISDAALERIDARLESAVLDQDDIVAIIHDETCRLLGMEPEEDEPEPRQEPVEVLMTFLDLVDGPSARHVLTEGPELGIPPARSNCSIVSVVAIAGPHSEATRESLRKAVGIMPVGTEEIETEYGLAWTPPSPVDVDWSQARQMARNLQRDGEVELGCVVIAIDDNLVALRQDGRRTVLTGIRTSTVLQIMDRLFGWNAPDGHEPECVCCAEGPAAYFAQQDRMIEEHGFSYSMISAGPDSPPFVYTIGLAEKGLPEFIFVGSARDAVPYLASLVEHVRQGGTIDPGVIPADVAPNGFTVPQHVIAADDKLATHALGVASRLERIGSAATPRLLQVVMPDMQGRFPWDEGYDWLDQQVAGDPAPKPTIH